MGRNVFRYVCTKCRNDKCHIQNHDQYKIKVDGWKFHIPHKINKRKWKDLEKYNGRDHPHICDLYQGIIRNELIGYYKDPYWFYYQNRFDRTNKPRHQRPLQRVSR